MCSPVSCLKAAINPGTILRFHLSSNIRVKSSHPRDATRECCSRLETDLSNKVFNDNKNNIDRMKSMTTH